MSCEMPESTTTADGAASAVAAPTELTIVGTRAGVPFPGDPSPGYVVRGDDTAVLLDCGPGVAGALWTYLDPGELDAVVISHLHSDHCYDLLPLGKHLVHHRMTHGDAGRVALLVPVGAGATLRALNQLFPVGGFAPALDRVFDEVFDMVEYEPGHTQAVGDVHITLEPVRHAVDCCAVRVDTTGGSVAYSGDTGWSVGLLRAALDADVLLCEASARHSGSHASHGHLSAREAGRAAAQADVRHLVLTHFTNTASDWIAALRRDAATEFEGPVSVARPGDRYRAAP
jgi:ribonuclease BN (tRNA processing enzyme)